MFFRQINPSKNPVLAESLSGEANSLNLRRIHVNAQVKATISLIETIILAVYVIVVWLTVRTTYTTLLITLTLYMIILPYFFLMNTSHNKDRVIEHGWKTVFRNVLGTKANGEVNEGHKCTADESFEGQQPAGKELENEAGKNIFTIGSTSSEIGDFKTPDSGSDDVSNITPCTSSGKRCAYEPNFAAPASSRKTSQQKEEKHYGTSITLILRLMENLNNEQQYIDHFKQFLIHESRCKKEDNAADHQCKHDIFPNVIQNETLEVGKSKGEGKNRGPIILNVVKPIIKSENAPELPLNIIDLDAEEKFQGEKMKRMLMRESLLQQIILTDDISEHESLIEKLIDMEESFVQ